MDKLFPRREAGFGETRVCLTPANRLLLREELTALQAAPQLTLLKKNLDTNE